MVKEYVDKLYDQLYSEKSYEAKSQILCTIIDIKCNNNIQDYAYPLYLDIKKIYIFLFKIKGG